MTDDVELQPDVDEIIQAEADDDYQAVKVCVESVKTPVRVQELPRKLATSRTLTVGTTPVRLLRADHYRAVATITSFDQDIYIAFNEGSATSNTSSARWTAVVPRDINAVTEIWVRAYTGTTEVSVITERWATGD